MNSVQNNLFLVFNQFQNFYLLAPVRLVALNQELVFFQRLSFNQTYQIYEKIQTMQKNLQDPKSQKLQTKFCLTKIRTQFSFPVVSYGEKFFYPDYQGVVTNAVEHNRRQLKTLFDEKAFWYVFILICLDYEQFNRLIGEGRVLLCQFTCERVHLYMFLRLFSIQSGQKNINRRNNYYNHDVKSFEK